MLLYIGFAQTLPQSPVGVVITQAGNGVAGHADGIGAAATFTGDQVIRCNVGGCIWHPVLISWRI